VLEPMLAPTVEADGAGDPAKGDPGPRR
jgi:hypothetical protein